MSIEELEELIRKYLSTGIAAVVVIVAPGTSTAPDGPPDDPSVRIIEPAHPDANTGAGGQDPEQDDPPGTSTGTGTDPGGTGSDDPGPNDSGRPDDDTGSDTGSDGGTDGGTDGEASSSSAGKSTDSDTADGGTDDEGSGSSGDDSSDSTDSGADSDSATGSDTGSGDESSGDTTKTDSDRSAGPGGQGAAVEPDDEGAGTSDDPAAGKDDADDDTTDDGGPEGSGTDSSGTDDSTSRDSAGSDNPASDNPSNDTAGDAGRSESAAGDTTGGDAPDAAAGDTGSSDPDRGKAGTRKAGTGAGATDGSGEEDAGGGSAAGGSGNSSRTAPGASGSAAGAAENEGTTAAETLGWGAPTREDDFTGGTDQWSIYDGPGHAGNGTRSPSAVTVADGVLTITGNSSGTTAGMAWNPGQKYGRWEGRVRAPASDPSYNALLLLWPDAEDFPVGGEIDFMEMGDPSRQSTDLFIHYGEDNSQVHGQVEIDATQWHNWAVEWTPEAITAYVDGEEWYRTTDTSIFPPGPMHLCIQLDWFPEDDSPEESYMYVDWVREYALDGITEPGGDSTDERSAENGASDSGADGEEDGSDQAGTGQNDAGQNDGDQNDEDDTGSRVRDAVRRLFYWR